VQHGALDRVPRIFHMVQQNFEHGLAAADPGEASVQGGDPPQGGLHAGCGGARTLDR